MYHQMIILLFALWKKHVLIKGEQTNRYRISYGHCFFLTGSSCAINFIAKHFQVLPLSFLETPWPRVECQEFGGACSKGIILHITVVFMHQVSVLRLIFFKYHESAPSGAHVPLGNPLFERLLSFLILLPRDKSHYVSVLDTERGRKHA
jgi:hypothetical protein